MNVPKYRPPPTLDTLPLEILLKIYDDLVHDPDPVVIETGQQPAGLEGLMSLRRTSKWFRENINLLELSRLVSAFYADNTLRFNRVRHIWGFVNNKPASVLRSTIRSIVFGGYDPDQPPRRRRSRTVSATRALRHFRGVEWFRLYSGPFDWTTNHYDVKQWLRQEESERREVCPLLFALALHPFYGISVPNRAVMEVVLKAHATVELDAQARFSVWGGVTIERRMESEPAVYRGDHGDVLLTYRESAARARDWRTIAGPVELPVQVVQTEVKLLTWK